MSSFPYVQGKSATNTSSITFNSTVTAGDILIAAWCAGGGSSIALPGAVTDNNGNVYALQSTSYTDANGISGIWVAVNAKVTPNNPPTVTFATVGSIDSGAPGIMIAEYGHSANYQIFGQNCAQQDGFIQFIVGCLTAPTTGQKSVQFAGYPAFGNSHNAAVVLQNQYADALLVCIDYENSEAFTGSWSISPGTIRLTFLQSGNESGVLADYAVNMGPGCGSLDLSVSCGNPPQGKILVPYGPQQIPATGGVPPYTFAIIAGALPPGLTMTSAGVISGTPTTMGSYTFTVHVTDSASSTASVTCSIVIAGSFIVQSVRLTDTNRLKTYKVSCVSGATVGSWLTALKYSINNS